MKEIRKFRLTEQEIAVAVSQYAIRKAGLLVDEDICTPVLFCVEPNAALTEINLTATVEVEA